MSCDNCGSERVVYISAHSRDCSTFILPSDNIDINGDYFSYVPDLCGGDDINIELCMDCGKVQGQFPKEVEN